MILKEYLDKLNPTDRILIISESGQVLFRGFGSGGKFVHTDLNAEILNIGIMTEPYKRERSIAENRDASLKAIDQENDYRYLDIEVRVYNKVTVKAAGGNDVKES